MANETMAYARSGINKFSVIGLCLVGHAFFVE